MREEEILEIFEEKGALLRGHFRLSSGLHSDIYIQCALVLQYPHLSTKLCEELGKKFKGKKIEVVIGPAIGGIIVSHEVARYLSIRSLFAERKEGVMQLRRGFRIEKGEKVLLVEDVITTGKSLQEVEDTVKESGGIIHYHETVPLHLINTRPFERVEKTAEKYGYKVSFLGITKVKRYAPGVEHIVLDAKLG